MESLESSLTNSWLGRKLLDKYRRLMYHHDYLSTSVLLMVIHTIFSVLSPWLAPHEMCRADFDILASHDEQFMRWLLLSIFSAVPLLLDIIFDGFKGASNSAERNRWRARIILLFALVIPSFIILAGASSNASSFQQCRMMSAVTGAQTMIIASSVMCTMFRQHNHVATDEEEKKNRFSIEKRSIGWMVHVVLTRIIIFLYYILHLGGAFTNIIVLLNILVTIHVVILFLRYGYVQVSTRVNGEFSSPQALNDFLYICASLTFGTFGLVVVAILQAAGVIRNSHDFSDNTVSVYRLMFLVCFTLFIAVVPGRVGMFAAKLEHQKLQTRLNLIRYVSHEMRSPLNTAFLGLEYVTGELTRMHHEQLRNHSNAVTLIGKGLSHADLEMGQLSHYANGKAHPHGASAASHIESPDASSVGNFAGDSERSTVPGGGHTARTGVSDVLDVVKQINASCNIALYTLNDLLTFDKLDEKKLEVELQPVNPWHFALDTAKPFKINAKESQVDFTISCEQYETKWYRAHQLRADEFKLSQVLRNLISNAVKFTPKKGRVHMKVEMIPNYASSNILIMGSTLGSLVRISVTDTGPGISAQNLGKLFGQYVQFNPSKLQKGGGSGLGLWISKSIVEMHGGTVHATSEGEGKGCTFILELPLYAEDDGSTDGVHSSGGATLPTHPEGDFEGIASPRETDPAQDQPESHPLNQPPQSGNQDRAHSPPPVNPQDNTMLGRFFRAKHSLQSGAKQFLNQKVLLKVNKKNGRNTPQRADSDADLDGGVISSKEFYSVNDESGNEHDSLEISGGDLSEKPLFRLGASMSGKKRSSVVPVTTNDTIVQTTRSSADQEIVQGANMLGESELIDLEAQIPYPVPTATPTPPRRDWNSPLRFLAVDDTALNRKMMGRLLRAAGHLVDEAEDGLECLTALHCSQSGPAVALSGVSASGVPGLNLTYDAVLIDENMPNMSGPDAVQRLRQCGYKGLLIGVTGDCYADQMARYIAMGADAVLPKPLKVDVLRAKLEELWRR